MDGSPINAPISITLGAEGWATVSQIVMRSATLYGNRL